MASSTNDEEEYYSSPEEWEDVDDQSSLRTASDYSDADDDGGGDFAYSDDDDEDGSGDSTYGEEETEEEEEDAMVARRSREKRYGVLTMDALRALQEEQTARVADLTLLPPALAAAVLRHCKWSAAAVEDRWFSDEQRVRDAVGLPDSGCCATVAANPAPLTCAICFDVHGAGEMRAAGCAAHFYCLDCWRGYLRAAVGDGVRCLSIRCPDPACSVAVARDLVHDVADAADARRYDEFAVRSFVEESKSIRWCPAPGCSHAVRYLEGERCTEQLDVTCACKHIFCLACGEEAHRPVPCDTVRAWLEKHVSDSETANWVLANTKHCPECRRPIEKNLGCMHMTCSAPCRHQFCWLCLGPWKRDHDGGYYNCNRYNADKAQGNASEDELRRRQAKASVDRYLHYYERWAAHERSGRKALEDMAALGVPGGEMEALATAFGALETDMDFLTAAYRQVAECRRMLRWTYAYGFYVDNPAKLEFFEVLQSDAEASLERLHGCAEEERASLAKGDDPAGSFAAYREKLASLTLVTRNHFENLARAFKNDLAEVTAVAYTKPPAEADPVPPHVAQVEEVDGVVQM